MRLRRLRFCRLAGFHLGPEPGSDNPQIRKRVCCAAFLWAIFVSMNPLSLFHPVVREWLETGFASPTETRVLAWPAIAKSRNTLISAPTGSGKTLAAFPLCIDRLFRLAVDGKLPDSVQIVYVSPLKALSDDIHRNLSLPRQRACICCVGATRRYLTSPA
jgi:superfamily II DNA/RNA helicase